MTKFTNLLSAAILSILFVACGGNTTKSAEEAPAAEEPSTGLSIDASAASLKWTAYKFTERVGVGGTFDEISVTAKSTEGAVEDMLTGGEISINTSSVNSGNEIRDPKLKASFFEPFNTPQITGLILSAEEGNGMLELTMNGTTLSNDFSYSVNDSSIVIRAEVDVANWNGLDAIGELNKVCEDLHIGADGTSKLWPDVSVVLSIPIKK